ncbi:MAG: ATP-binding protein [Rhodospirillaceae bacterium]
MIFVASQAPARRTKQGDLLVRPALAALMASWIAAPGAALAQDGAGNQSITLLVPYLLLAVLAGALVFGIVRALRRGRDLSSVNEKLSSEIEGRAAAEVGKRESDENFLRFVEGVTDYAIYMLDPKGYVTTWNAGAERIKGYTASEILGRHFSCFYTPEDQAAGIPAKVLATAEREGRYEAEQTVRVRKDGSQFHASIVMDRLTDPSGRLMGYAKITRDISERVQQNAALEEARAALAQSQKMEAIGHLTGGIAHDFNNMLAVIIGALNMMQRRIARGDYNVEPLVNAAVEGAMRGAQLTHRLLAFARKQVLEPRPIDANKLLGGMSDLVRRSLGETIQTEIVTEGGLWRIYADAHQLETAIINLVVNARDAMADGGKLTVETANASISESYARTAGIEPGQYVAICVTDTGNGMPQHVIDKAFDPFFTTKTTGTGLGLSQVYGFVKQSGGHVKIYSEQGIGTTVKIYLPRYFGPKEETAAVQPAAAPMAKAGETILVVEDEPAVRRLTVQSLADLGYTVVEAESGVQALGLLEKHPDLALLFTDVVMPQMNGRQLAHEATQRRPGLKVLYTTGYTRNAVVHNGVLDPGVKLLHKPFTLDALANAVRRAIDA